MASIRYLSQYIHLFIILSMIAFISVSEAAHLAPTPAPSPAQPSRYGHGAPPLSAAAQFSQIFFVSVLIPAFMSHCLSFSIKLFCEHFHLFGFCLGLFFVLFVLLLWFFKIVFRRDIYDLVKYWFESINYHYFIKFYIGVHGFWLVKFWSKNSRNLGKHSSMMRNLYQKYMIYKN